jgi:hypothetical protein
MTLLRKNCKYNGISYLPVFIKFHVYGYGSVPNRLGSTEYFEVISFFFVYSIHYQ